MNIGERWKIFMIETYHGNMRRLQRHAVYFAETFQWLLRKLQQEIKGEPDLHRLTCDRIYSFVWNQDPDLNDSIFCFRSVALKQTVDERREPGRVDFLILNARDFGSFLGVIFAETVSEWSGSGVRGSDSSSKKFANSWLKERVRKGRLFNFKCQWSCITCRGEEKPDPLNKSADAVEVLKTA